MNICVLPGDGIGPEVIGQAVKVLEATGLSWEFTYGEIGFAAYQKHGTPLPDQTLAKVDAADATLFGAVTTPPGIPDYTSPILQLRKQFDLFANLRPSRCDGVDLAIVRENTEGLYSGVERIEDGGDRVIAERVVSRRASDRIIRYAFEYARAKGYGEVTVVHKANVLRHSDGLFRSVAQSVATEYVDIELKEMLVDSCAMQLVVDPSQFQVLVTTNLFGDILSDVACVCAGGLGMAASANIGEATAIFEPVHGSASDIVGTGRANPFATIRSAALMLRYLQCEIEATRIDDAVDRAVQNQQVTPDLNGALTTAEATDTVISCL